MPIITISRGTFSGGRDLAEALARDLHAPCISREVLVEAGAQYGVSEGALSAALSQAPSLLDRLKRDRDRYLAFIRAVLYKHAREGDFIYHGHGGHHLLAGIRHVIRVRVVADTSSRIGAAMKELNMTSRQAEADIKKFDSERRKWTRFLYGVSWEDPSNYDVVLNLEYLGIEGACAVVVRLTELPQFQATDESRQALADLALQSFVLAALASDERTRDADFRVRAHDGVISVEVVARLAEMTESVGEIASRVEGVTKVVNQVVTLGIPV
jgi:cytidylate kinase